MTKPIPASSHPLRKALLGLLAIVVIAFGICEALGWPFLAAPLQQRLSAALHRKVQLGEDPSKPSVVIHLLGGLRMRTAYLEIGAPAWSKAPYMVQARDANVTLGYLDLWRASRGEALHIRDLRAGRLDGSFERLADGRASWQFSDKTQTPDPQAKPTQLPVFGRLQVDGGGVTYNDAMMAINLDAKFSLTEGTAYAAKGASAPGFSLQASGAYRKSPLRVELHTPGVLPVLADDAEATPLPVTFEARAGGARMSFIGTATDVVHFTALKGRFDVQGPSLAAIGDPLGVTLPTTGAFRTDGLIVKDGVVWKAVFNHIDVGASRLGGAFTYDPRPKVPELAGQLTGSKLQLEDLGPAVGTPPARPASGAASAAAATSQPADKANKKASPTATTASSTTAKPKDPSKRVLPQRAFDLPSLRAMNANVLIDIDSLDLGSSVLEPLKPIRTHLVLKDGVLVLQDIDARTGQGRLAGKLQLDGRNSQALWTADLRVNDVKLESWLHQNRSPNAPPYLTGDLDGQVRVAGEGKSTATILGSLRGGMRFHVVNGTVSHLIVEASGLDIAQGLGLLFSGDESLALKCTVADMKVDQGTVTPSVFVVDTDVTTLWIDGSLSLGTEAMDLRVVVSPKNFTPLSLRAPLRVRGTLGDPALSLDPSTLGTKLGAAALLALLNPLAAVIPLIDPGNAAAARSGSERCQSLADRIAKQPLLAPPPGASQAARQRAGASAAAGG